MRAKHLLGLWLWIGAIFQLSAHPHLFITSTVEFVWEGANLKGVYIQWTFDRFFSADIIRGYDLDRNGIFNRNETREVHDNAFINLENYYFFTFIRQGDRRTSPRSVSRFSVTQANNIVTYRFFVDLSAYDGPLFLAVYDYTYFCAIKYDERMPVKLTFDPAYVRPSYTIRENRNFPVFYNPLSPGRDTTIHTRWRPGLNTFYPKEIRISYDT